MICHQEGTSCGGREKWTNTNRREHLIRDKYFPKNLKLFQKYPLFPVKTFQLFSRIDSFCYIFLKFKEIYDNFFNNLKKPKNHSVTNVSELRKMFTPAFSINQKWNREGIKGDNLNFLFFFLNKADILSWKLDFFCTFVFCNFFCIFYFFSFFFFTALIHE